jgi:biopolymer transport protein TolR
MIGKDEALQLKLKDKTTSLRLQDITSAVKQAQGTVANTAVVISADKAVKYEAVVRVMDTLQRAGIARVGLSVQLAP